MVAPSGLVTGKVGINKHRNGDFVSPQLKYIGGNRLLCIAIETKPVIFLEDIRTDSWVATIKN